MDIHGFTKEGNWYKGNLHSHTVNSDGHLTPEESVKLFKDHQYSFLCLSEHDLYTDYREKFNTDEFIILPGLEASATLLADDGTMLRKKTHHIHGILGTSEMQQKATKAPLKHMEKYPMRVYFGEWDGRKAAQDLVDDLVSMGMITTYNHPVWSRVREEEFIYTKGVWALEIFNYDTVNESNTGYDVTYWDVMLREGIQRLGFASDDNHNEGNFEDSCGGYIMVKAEELTHDCILENMLKGNYYSSAGPEIYDWGIRENKIYIQCSEVYRIDFIVGNAIGDGATVMCRDLEDTISQAVYDLKGHEKYVRVQCTDKYGRTAWTNPIFIAQ